MSSEQGALRVAILTISVLVFGGFRVTLLGQRISVTEWWRPVLWAAGGWLAGQVVHAEAPDRIDPPLPMLQYGPETRFPLWGAPGRAETEKKT